jgi:hypothetical protein
MRRTAMPRIALPLLLMLTLLVSACAPTVTAVSRPATPPPAVKVEVIDIPKGADLVATLKAKGINAVLYPKNERIVGEEQNRVIWLGKNVPLDVLRTTMDETLRVFPLMNFLYVVGDKGELPPEDRHYSLFIGGSTEAALFMKLTVIPVDKLKEVLATAATIDDVHRFLHDWNRQETMIK